MKRASASWGEAFLGSRALLGSVLFLGLSGCSLLVDGEAASQGCPTGTKACDGRCVSTSDEDYGCGAPGCSPCALFRATATCGVEGECVIASCVGAWEDCDEIQENGCEVNSEQDPAHCGGCSKQCKKAKHGESSCGNANCYVRECDDGYADCDDLFENGCETVLETADSSCGGSCNGR